MKKSLQLLMMAALVLSTAACVLFEKTLEFNSNIFTLNINVSESASSPYTYEYTKTWQMNDADFIKYEGDITNFEVKGVTYQITSFTNGAPDTKLNGTLYYKESGVAGATFKEVGKVTDLALSNDQVHSMQVDLTEQNVLRDLLKRKAAIDLKFVGTSDKTPVTATVKFFINGNYVIAI